MLAIGLCVGIGGAAVLALTEFTLVYVTSRAHFQQDPVQLGVIIAVIGKLAVSHTLLWVPVMLLLTLAYACAFGRRPAARPEAAIPALFIAAGGLLVVPADLDIINQARTLYIVGGCIAVLVAAITFYIVARTLMHASGLRFVRFAGGIATAGLGLITVLTGIAFSRSPLWNPAEHRLRGGDEPSYAVVGGRPHVLWIVLDTARADRLSCYDPAKRTTPFIEQWAAQSLIFENAYSSGNWTAPAHASMFTGLPLRQHRFDNDHPDLPDVRLHLPDGATTAAEALHGGGYATGMFSNNPIVNRDMNLAQGFERCEAAFYLRRLGHFSLESLYEKWGLTWPIPWFDGDYGAALTNELVAGWLERTAATGRPTFVFINYMEAHLPYRVPRRYREMFMDAAQVARSYALRWTVYGNLLHAFDLNFSIDGGDFSTLEDREIVRRQYEACIRYLDDRVAEIIELYRRRGMLDNTLVVITSDHGEHLDTHGLWGHRLLLWQDLTHVVMVLREPGRTQGERRALPAQLSDLYQTTINFALGRRDPGPAFDARDLLASPDAAPSARIAISEYNGPERSVLAKIRRSTHPNAPSLVSPRTAAVEGRWKYIESQDGTRELFDLHADRGELRNVAAEHPTHVERLAAYLAAWRNAVPDAPPWQGAAQPTGEDVERILKSLGYLGDE